MKLKPEQQMELTNLLPQLALFKGIDAAAVQALVPLADAMVYAKNKVILMEQELAQQIFILVKGRVSIWRLRGSDKELVATLTAPNFFGELSVFAESSASAQVKTYDECLVYVFRKEDLDRTMAKLPALQSVFSANMQKIRQERPVPAKREDA